MRPSHLNALLIVAILLICTVPLYAQGQQPDVAKLKADARNVVSTITGDKAKSQTYCQVLDLSAELDQIDPHKDTKKAKDLSQKVDDLQKNLALNISRCSKPLRTSIQIRKTARRLCRSSLCSTSPVRSNRHSRPSIAKNANRPGSAGSAVPG